MNLKISATVESRLKRTQALFFDLMKGKLIWIGEGLLKEIQRINSSNLVKKLQKILANDKFRLSSIWLVIKLEKSLNLYPSSYTKYEEYLGGTLKEYNALCYTLQK